MESNEIFFFARKRILCLVSKSGPVTVQTGELRGNVHTQVVPGHVRAPLVSQGLVMEAENVPDIYTLVLSISSEHNPHLSLNYFRLCHLHRHLHHP